MEPARSGTIEANIVHVQERRIHAGVVTWEDGIICAIEERGGESAGLPYLIPGFIDAHVHIESSMLTPSEFGRQAVRHGTVAAVSDPHEIANVLGMEGVGFMLDNAAATPFHLFFGAPSCVPASPFETAGDALGVEEMEALLAREDIWYLSEMMNFPGVLNQDTEVSGKIAAARRLGLPVDGHAPGLRGDEAARYAAAGISTDHECYSLEEAHDKLAAGMKIQIRESSAARNFDTLHPLITTHPDRVMFCSDDKHPDDLLEGHIDRLAARAVQMGHAPLDVLQCACVTPVLHYSLPVGLLRVGDAMDAVLVEDLERFRVQRTWLRGELAAEEGTTLLSFSGVETKNRFHARPITVEDLTVMSEGGTIRVMEALDGELITNELQLVPRVEDGKIIPDVERDILMICVLNRYRPAAPAVAFIRGFGLQKGAIASSVAHDSHNIVAVGADPHAICQAVNGVVAARGGIALSDGAGCQVLELPVAGIMSPAPAEEVGRKYAELDRAARALGSPLRAPFMTLSFMALLVIPALKLSDKGLFDGRNFRLTDLHTT